MDVVSLLVIGQANDHFDQGNRGHWAPVFTLALALPLFWRRRHPAEVFAAVSAIALVQWLSNVVAGGDFAVFGALYALGAYESRRRVLAAGVLIAELGVVLAVVRWSPPDHRLTGIIFLTGTVTAAWVSGAYLRTRRQYLASVLERAATAERERDQQALIAVAGERARISREMHDIVAHSLSVMIALSNGAAAAVTRDPEAARTTMGQASTLGRQALGEVRRLLGDQDRIAGDGGSLAPQPGIAQLDDLVTQVRAAGLAVELVVAGDRPALAPGAQLAVFRMVQEALTNVLKHARAATQATVTLRYRPDGIDIEIENDDSPASTLVAAGRPLAASGTGRGLAGMRERAAVFGGTVESSRQPGGGWRVVSRLTLQENPDR